MLAEVAHGLRRAEQVACRARENNLTAVGSSGDARSAVHLETHVALAGDQRLSRMDPDAHADRTIAKPVADLGCRSGRGACSAERREERVALRVNLDTRVPAQGSPDDNAVGGEEFCILIAVLVEKPRRTIDVGEEKCHRTSR